MLIENAETTTTAEIADAPTTYWPLGDHLIVLPVDPDATTRGGLYIPDVHRERPQLARVLAVGPLVKGDVQKNDVVLYAKYAGHEVAETIALADATVERQVLVLPESQMLAIVGGSRRPAPF